MLRRLLGFLLGCLVRVLTLTWRVKVSAPAGLFARREPLVFAFWHGKQLALQAAPLRRPALVMVSHSKDGTLQASALGLLGFRVIRGSSSRGAARATRSIVRELASSTLDAVFAVDGPRGPRERAKPGAGRIAHLAKGALVPLGSASSHRILLGGAWDRFEIPLPFARVAIVFGEPVTTDEPELLGAAIDSAGRRAQAVLKTPSKIRIFSQEGGKGRKFFVIGSRRKSERDFTGRPEGTELGGEILGSDRSTRRPRSEIKNSSSGVLRASASPCKNPDLRPSS